MALGFFLVKVRDIIDPTLDLSSFDGMVVCSHGVTLGDANEKAPNALAYSKYLIPHGIPDAGVHQPHMQDLRQRMAPHILMDGGGNWVRHPELNQYEVDFTVRAALELSAWALDSYKDWDVVYVDDCWDRLPDHQVELRGGDAEALRWEWESFRGVLLGRMKSKTLVGNIGAAESRPPGLSAVTIEQRHIDRDPTLNQRFADWPHHLNTVWNGVHHLPGVVSLGITRDKLGR